MKYDKQQGMSALGLLGILLLGSFLLIVATRVGPLYLDNFFVKASLDSLEKEPLSELSEAQIKRKLVDYFEVNNVRDIEAKKAVINRTKKRITVELNYERRVYFLMNIDVVVSFNNTYEGALL